MTKGNGSTRASRSNAPGGVGNSSERRSNNIQKIYSSLQNVGSISTDNIIKTTSGYGIGTHQMSLLAESTINATNTYRINDNVEFETAVGQNRAGYFSVIRKVRVGNVTIFPDDPSRVHNGGHHAQYLKVVKNYIKNYIDGKYSEFEYTKKK